MVLTRRFRPVALLASVALAFAPSLYANPTEGRTAWSQMQIHGSSDLAASDEAFSSGFELFYAGPQWFLSALSNPGGTRTTRARLADMSYDSAGDRIVNDASYVGTLTNSYLMSDTSAASPLFYARHSSTEISSVLPNAPDASPSIWDGGGADNLWTNALNWGGNVPVPSATYDLQFGGTTNLSTNNNFTAGSLFHNITFNSGAGAFTLAGNSFGLRGDVTNSSTNLQTITLNLGMVTAARTFTMTAGGGDITIGVSGDATKGVISGTAGLTTAGTGTLTLWGNNSYSGTTTAAGAGAILALGNDNALGTSGLTLSGGTIAAVGGSRTITNAISINGSNGTIGGSDSLTLNGNWTQTATSQLTLSNSGGTTIGGTISLTTSATARTMTFTGGQNITFGSGSVIQNGGAGAGSVTFNTSFSGTATINGTNTYSGATTLSNSAANFVLGNKAAFGTSTVGINGVSISANTDLSGANAIANTVTIGGNDTFTGSNNIELSGSVTSTLSALSRSITNNMSGATLTLSGNVFLSNNNTTTTNGLTFGGSGTTLVSGVIANNNAGNTVSATLVKSGAGVLTLTNANTYTGTTTVNGGKLYVNGSLNANSAVTVNNAGTVLGGTAGTINGSVGVNSGAILQGGTGSTGQTLTLTGAVTMNSGSILQLALGASTNSTIAISGGTLAFDTNQQFHFIDVGATTTTYNGLITGVPDPGAAVNSWVITNPGWTGTFAWDGAGGGEIDLTLTAVPEPSTWIGAALALGAIGFTQRKRFAKRSRVIG